MALEAESERKQGELTYEKEMKCQSPYSRLDTTKVWQLSLQISVLYFLVVLSKELEKAKPWTQS